MKTLIGGAVAAVFGLIGLSIWFGEFLQLLAGSIPVMLLVGGGLALYLGFDELKDTWRTSVDEDATLKSTDDEYKDEINRLKSEIENLKSSEKA